MMLPLNQEMVVAIQRRNTPLSRVATRKKEGVLTLPSNQMLITLLMQLLRVISNLRKTMEESRLIMRD